jgi:mono/diheme cytochrome c family protein
MRRKRIMLVAVLVASAAAGVAAYAYGVERAREKKDLAVALTRGNPALAASHMIYFGCGGCHTIPGVPGARGLVGPPLNGAKNRMYLGGVVENTPKNLIQWIVDPRALDPKSAMPKTGISEAQARDVAAYLYAR